MICKGLMAPDLNTQSNKNVMPAKAGILE